MWLIFELGTFAFSALTFFILTIHLIPDDFHYIYALLTVFSQFIVGMPKSLVSFGERGQSNPLNTWHFIHSSNRGENQSVTSK